MAFCYDDDVHLIAKKAGRRNARATHSHEYFIQSSSETALLSTSAILIFDIYYFSFSAAKVGTTDGGVLGSLSCRVLEPWRPPLRGMRQGIALEPGGNQP